MLTLIFATSLQTPVNIQFLFTRLVNDNVEVCRYDKGNISILLKEAVMRTEFPSLDQFSIAISADSKRFLRVPLVNASIRSIKVYGIDGTLQSSAEIKEPRLEPWIFGFDDEGNAIGLLPEGENYRLWQMSKGEAGSPIANDKLPNTFKEIASLIDPPVANTPFWTNGNSWHEPHFGASDGADAGRGVAAGLTYWFRSDGEFGRGNDRIKFALPKGYDYLFAMQQVERSEYLGIIGVLSRGEPMTSRQSHSAKCASMRSETGEITILCDAVVAVPLR